MKQRFTRADGTRGTVARFLELPALRPGYWWVNFAPMGAGFNHWVETIAPTKGANDVSNH